MASVKPILESAVTRYPRGNFAIALACLLLIGIAWWVTLDRVRFERTETIANTVKQNENLAIAYEEHTIRTLRGIDQAVLFVKDQYDEHGLKLNIGRMIEKGTLDAGLFNYIGITDERGNVVLGSYEFKPTNLADRESFKVHQQNNDNEMFIGKLNLGRITHKWAMPMSHRINKPDGSFGGIVYASVDPEYFTRFYQQADLGEQGVVTLIGLDGIVRARRAGAKGSFGEDMHGARLFLEQARTKVGSFLGETRMDSVPRFMSFRTLVHYPLIVVVGTSESEAMARFHTREHGYYLNALVASVIILTFAAFMIVVWSRQKRAVDSLIESEARYRATFGQGAVGVAHTTLDGCFIEVNAKLSEILGYTSAELSAMNVNDVIAPQDRDQARSDRARLVAGELADWVAETGIVRKDGSAGWISRGMSLVRDASGRPKYCISLLFDITERKQAQHALAESEARFRGLAEQSLAGIIIHNQQRYLYVNPGFAEMFGYTQDEVMKQNPIELVAEQERARVRELVGKRMSGEIRQLRYTLRGVRKDGTVIEVETHGSRMMLAGSPELVVIVLDITERKRNEQALRSSATRLRELSRRLQHVEQTERQAISRELHDRIGQDLSTLTLLFGKLAARLSKESPSEIRKQLQDMQDLLKSMIANVRDVMAELRPPVLDDYGLLPALRQLATEFAQRSGINAELSGVDLQPRLASIVETAMFRICQEALSNIAKHAQAKKVEISLSEASGRVVLDIADDGVGFDTNKMPQGREHWGMITMRERAEAAGIALRLESAPGAGTRVVLEAERAAS